MKEPKNTYPIVSTLEGTSSCNCTSLEICESQKCQPSSCFDLEWSPNINETDVDCGGNRCLRKCVVFKHCDVDDDCITGVCSEWKHVCLPKSCRDFMLSGNESAIDCGGPQCDPCEAGKDCERNQDCISGRCETKDRFICLSDDCDDKNCGSSPFCPRCPVGSKCEHDAQCQTDHCDSGVCYLTNCERCGVRPECPPCSAGESCDDDSQCASKMCSEISNTCLAENCDGSIGRCGGLCDPCGVGGSCDSDTDCASGLRCDSDSNTCAPVHCFDGILTEKNETDVDCGGECAQKCSFLQQCSDDMDCADQGICDLDVKLCIAPSCVNQIMDHEETGVDCGNSAKSGCLPCQKSGSGCTDNSDADSNLGLVCDINSKSVVPSHCMDRILNEDEVGVDCGGPSCAKRCPGSSNCVINSDCESNDCFEGICAPVSCNNTKLDFNETDIDCGGGWCRPCSLSFKCRLDSDCSSGMCSEFTSRCQPFECATHCGGPCDPCPDSTPCSSDSDCSSGYCYGEALDTSSSLFVSKNSQTGSFLFPEAARGVCIPSLCRSACGKGDCPGCPGGAPCEVDHECASGYCDENTHRCFASSCFDSIQGEEESDVDCGGPVCPVCTLPTQKCNKNSDCASRDCSVTRGTCVPASCFNSILDAEETDFDCGGPHCISCNFTGASCLQTSDCASRLICADPEKVCLPSHCFNEIRDDEELDVDCGETCMKTCKDGSSCAVDADCLSGFCYRGHCLAEKCKLGCGQVDCDNKCEPGEYCESNSQCDANSLCIHSKCVNEEGCKSNWHAFSATDPSGCGGSKCARCGPHRLCSSASDCDTGLICNTKSKRCEFETCFDGILSYGEICIDAGGVCKRRCPIGENCKSAYDCERGRFCSLEGFCTTTPPIVPPKPEVKKDKPPRKLDKLDEEPFELDLVPLKIETQGWRESLAKFWDIFREVYQRDLILQKANEFKTSLGNLNLESLCDDTFCVVETITNPDQKIQPHSFYLLDADINVPLYHSIEGFFLSSFTEATFPSGVEARSLSYVSNSAYLELGGNCKFFDGLIVDSDSKLVLLSGGHFSGKKLIVFGDISLHENVILDFETIHVFGKVTIPFGEVTIRNHTVIHGALVINHASTIRSSNLVIEGALLFGPGSSARFDLSQVLVKGNMLIPSDSTVSFENKCNISFLESSNTYVAGQLQALENSNLIIGGSFVAWGNISSAWSLTSLPNSFLILGNLSFSNFAEFSSPVLLLGTVSSNDAATLSIKKALEFFKTVPNIIFSSKVDFQEDGLLVIPFDVKNVTFEKSVIFSSNNKRFTSSQSTFRFLNSLITTRPLSINSKQAFEFSGDVWFTNSLENLGKIIMLKSSKAMISHTYVGNGTIVNDGSLYVLGDALVSSTSFTGSGSVLVGGLTDKDMRVFARSFSIPQRFCSGSFQGILLSVSSTTNLKVNVCLEGNPKEGMRRILNGEELLFTRNRGMLIDYEKPLPQVVEAVPSFSQFDILFRKGFDHEIHSSPLEGGTLEFTQGAAVSITGEVTVTKTGHLATSKKAKCVFGGGMHAQGDVWFGPDSKSTLHWIVDFSGNCTIEKHSNVTCKKSSISSSGRFTQSGSLSIESASNFSSEGYFENNGDFLSESSTSVSFLSGHSSWAHFYFTEHSILDSRGFLYFGPKTKSSFEKGSLLETSGDFVLEKNGVVEIHTPYTFFEGNTEVFGSLVSKKQKLKFVGRKLHVGKGGSLIIEGATSHSEFQAKHVLIQGIVSGKDGASIVHNANKGVFEIQSGGSFNASMKFRGLQSSVILHDNSSLSCHSACEFRSESMTLKKGSRMMIHGQADMDTNMLAEEGSSISLHGGTLSVLNGDFAMYGEFKNHAGHLILETKKISGRGHLLMERTTLKTESFDTHSCSGDTLVVQRGGTLRISFANNSQEMIKCEGTSAIRVEEGGRLVISNKVKMLRDLITEKGSFLIIEGNSTLQLGNAETLIGGSISFENQSTLYSSSTNLTVLGEMFVLNSSHIVFDTGETKILESASIHVFGGSKVEIKPRSFFSLASLLSLTESTFECFGKMKNTGHFKISGHGSKAIFSGHYVGTGNIQILNFAKVFIRNSFSSTSDKFENTDGLLVFVAGSEAFFKTKTFRFNSGRMVQEEKSRVAIESEEIWIGIKSKILISGGRITLHQLNGVLENGGSWISSHDSNIAIIGSFRLKRGVKMELEGKVSFNSTSYSDFLGLEARASLRLISGVLELTSSLFLDESSEVEILGNAIFHSRFVNSGGSLRVEGHLSLLSGDGNFKDGSLFVAPSGRLDFKNEKCDEDNGYLLSKGTSRFEGTLNIEECSKVSFFTEFVSSGDLLILGQVTFFSQARIEKSPSHITIEGKLVVEKGADLKWLSNAVGSRGAVIQVLGSAEFSNEISFNDENKNNMKSIMEVKAGGVVAGNIVLKNCTLVVHGRLEPGDLKNAGTITIENGDLDIFGVLEVDVQMIGNEIVHDTVDVKSGSVHLNPKSTLAIAVLDLEGFDIVPIVCDSGKLYFNDVKVAIYSVMFDRKIDYSHHFYEVDTMQKFTSLHVRAEKTFSSTNLISKEGFNQIIFSNNPVKNDWKEIVEYHLGGLVFEMDNLIVSLHCFEPSECSAFCRILELTREQLQIELQVHSIKEYPIGSCKTVESWPNSIPPCVTDGRGTAKKGELCKFPFEFQDITYPAMCAKDEAMGEWCLTEDGHWGGCVCGPFETNYENKETNCFTNGLGYAPKGVPCKFPFFENSGGYQPHSQCIGTGLGGFGFCRTAKGELGGCSCKQQQSAASSSCITNGRGPASPGKNCFFPFTWSGKQRFHCVGSGWGGEGFCQTFSGERGGCACSLGTQNLETDSGKQEEDSGVYFVNGPNIRVLNHNSVRVYGEINKADVKWSIFAVETGDLPPSNLDDPTSFTYSNEMILKGLDWKKKYDFYSWVTGFENRDDFLANVIVDIQLKPPPGKVERFTVSFHSLNLVEGDDKGILISIEKARGIEGLVDIKIELSQTSQVSISSDRFLLQQEKTIELKAYDDNIIEGPHTVFLYIIDVVYAATETLELQINEDGGKRMKPLVKKLSLDFPVNIVEEEDVETFKNSKRYRIELKSPPLHPVLVQIQESNENIHPSPSVFVFGRESWNKPQLVHFQLVKGRMATWKFNVNHKIIVL